MRRGPRIAVLLCCVLLAATARADQFGPVLVESLDSVAGMRRGCYHEYRFTAFNPTADPHVVRIDVEGMVMHMRSSIRTSRTVVVAPRSAAIVSIPQFIADGTAATLARIAVDGDDAGELQLAPGGVSRGYTTYADVLVGRLVPQSIVTPLTPSASPANLVRASLPPRAWSANWLAYTSFAGAILTKRDWLDLPRPVQTALLRWISAGGSLTLLGMPEGFPPLRGQHLGFGSVFVLPENVQTLDEPDAVRRTWYRVDADPPFPGRSAESAPRPLIENNALPVKSLFGVLVLFAIVGGPVNMIVLAKKQRRVWIFWTVPVLALIASVVLVGAVVANEGWVRVQKSVSVTLLDEYRGEASTIGWTGIYATLPQDGNVRFDSATDVRPLFISRGHHTDWTDGQRLVSGWIDSRVPASFAVRKVEPRRERVPIRRVGDHYVALNGLGVDIRELHFMNRRGDAFVARNIPAGREAALTPGKQPSGRNPADVFGPPGLWPGAYDRVAGAPADWLGGPGTYVAIVSRSPFLESALANPTTSTSDAVILGIPKELDHEG